MSKLIGLVLYIAINLIVIALLWLLYTWAMPQLWIGGPENLVNPGYWLFTGSWVLLGLVGRRVFGRSSGKAK